VTTARVGLAVLDSDGVLDLSRNWFNPGWVDGFGGLSGEIHDDGTSIETSSSGIQDFANQKYELATGSVCIDGASPLPPPFFPEHDVSTNRLNINRAADACGAAFPATWARTKPAGRWRYRLFRRRGHDPVLAVFDRVDCRFEPRYAAEFVKAADDVAQFRGLESALLFRMVAWLVRHLNSGILTLSVVREG